MNEQLYLNKEYNFSENRFADAELLATVQVHDVERFNNYHTSLYPKGVNGEYLSFGGWHLKEFYVNRQWNEAYILRLIVARPHSPFIDMGNIIHQLDHRTGIRWYNCDRLQQYSRMFKRAIRFLEEIPNDINSLAGVELYYNINTANNMIELADVLKTFESNGTISNLSYQEPYSIVQAFSRKMLDLLNIE